MFVYAVTTLSACVSLAAFTMFSAPTSEKTCVADRPPFRLDKGVTSQELSY